MDSSEAFPQHAPSLFGSGEATLPRSKSPASRTTQLPFHSDHDIYSSRLGLPWLIFNLLIYRAGSMTCIRCVDTSLTTYHLELTRRLCQVYTAYMGYFQLNGIPWSFPILYIFINADVEIRYERSWGHLFATFDEFLSFSWPVITVTDAKTGRGHIVTRVTSIGAYIKMIKTRYVPTG